MSFFSNVRVIGLTQSIHVACVPFRVGDTSFFFSYSRYLIHIGMVDNCSAAIRYTKILYVIPALSLRDRFLALYSFVVRNTLYLNLKNSVRLVFLAKNLTS